MEGGVLVPVFKGKGSPSDSLYRSIFLSDICAKLHHAKIRTCLVEAWIQDNSLLQMGGKKGCSTDVAHHFLHTHLAWAKSANVPCAMLFVDLQAAFYSVLRSMLTAGQLHYDLLCFAMHRLGISPPEWHKIRDQVGCDHATQGLDNHSDAMIRDMFSETHFLMQSLDARTATTRGTRPCDPVADVLFNMAFKLVVLDARERIRASSPSSWFGDPVPSN